MHKLDWLENGKIEKLVTALRQLAKTNTNTELVRVREADSASTGRRGATAGP
jgi:hypothetical protein